MTDDELLLQWIREEAFNWTKILNGERRLSFLEWMEMRDRNARTGKPGSA